MVAGEERSLGAVGGVGLGEDVGDMDVDGTGGEEEGVGDLTVRHARGDEAEDLDFTGGEAGREARSGLLQCGEARGQGFSAGKCGPRAERCANRTHRFEVAGRIRSIPLCRVELGQRKQGEGTLVGCGTCVGESEGGREVCGGGIYVLMVSHDEG